MKVFHPKKPKFPELDDLLVYYYYNLDYSSKKEEEHKLEAWEEWVKTVFAIENRLFMSTTDLIVSLAYTIDDEEAVKDIIKDLKRKKSLEKISKHIQPPSSFFAKLVSKVVQTFASGSNIIELSNGLYCCLSFVDEKVRELEEQVIRNRMVSERKVKDFLKWKYRYSEVEQELLLMYMKNYKIIEIWQVTIKDETTEEESEYRAVFSVEKCDSNEQKNLKLLELEINLYTLSDAIEEIESIKKTIQDDIKLHVRENRERMVFDFLKYTIYAEEVWVNLARSITMIEEQVHAFQNISEITIQLLIRQSRRDIFFFEKWRKYLKKVIDFDEAEDEEGESEIKEKLTLPQWIRKVEINPEEVQNDVNILMAENDVRECDEFLNSFLKKVKIDIKTRETFNLARRSMASSEHMQNVPSSYMNTITKFQEFFGLDENCDFLIDSDNPFDRDTVLDNLELDGQGSDDSDPVVRKSVMVAFEDKENYNHVF
jgi:hypothetical protein